jgi:DNA-binding LacI/PurR family transcriptional regulator
MESTIPDGSRPSVADPAGRNGAAGRGTPVDNPTAPRVPTGRMKRVSMADVARVAGVSSQTVSRVSNGTGDVVEATRERVLAAMAELGYRPNGAARALKRGEFRTIGVIVFSLSTFGNMRTVEAIADSAAREGYAITLIPVAAPTEEKMAGAFTRLDELAVDGVIVIMEVHRLDSARLAFPPGMPVVVVDSDAGDRFSVVDVDQAAGASQAVNHLLELGHHTVWHVAGPEESFASERRTRTWREVLTAAGRPVPPLERGDWSAESGYEVGLRLARMDECTAVFAANDQMALGILRALHECGRRVPAEVSVVGFDDRPDSGSYFPPLTTIHQDFARVGRLTVEHLLEQLRTHSRERGTTLVSTELVVRESTAPPGR